MRCAGKEEAQWLDGLVRCLELSVAITLTTFNQKFIFSAVFFLARTINYSRK